VAGKQPARITIRVQPNAKRNEVARFEGGVLHLKIAAPPVKGKANQEAVRFLADILGIPKTSITIERGTTSRMKVIAIEGMSQEEIKKRIDDCLV